MFSLKQHARNKARLVVIGAAASASLLAADANAAVTLFWDPGLSATGTGSGGTGTFDNTLTNFYNGTADVAATSSSNVDFTTIGGAVNVDAATIVNTLTLGVGGYTFSGSALTLNAGASNLVTQTAGDNIISAPILIPNGGSATNQTWNITGNLTLGNLTQSNLSSGGYCAFLKTGTGSIIVTGTFSAHRSDGLNVQGGLVSLQGTGNILGNGLTVGSAGTVTGNATSQMTGSLVDISGNLAPGANIAGSNYGGIGTFAVTGVNGTSRAYAATFESSSQFDLDLDPANAGVNDALALTSGTFTSPLTLNIDSGATVNINNGTGSLTPGTYHIITMALAAGTSTTRIINDTATANGVGFTIGNAPAGYTYTFVNDGSGTAFTGVDLIVAPGAPVPEPASLALLGLGAGLLFTRKRRGRQ